MFLKNCWYVAAWDHELIDGKMLARNLPGINFSYGPNYDSNSFLVNNKVDKVLLRQSHPANQPAE